MSFATAVCATALRGFRRPILLSNTRTLAMVQSLRESSLKFSEEHRSLKRPFVRSIQIPVRGFAAEVDNAAIDFHEFQNNLGDQSYLIVDVREPEELTRDGKIFGTVNIPLGKIDSEFSLSPRQLQNKYHRASMDDKGRNVIFFCRAGVRAQKALAIAQKHGWTGAQFYKGSFNDWVERGGPVVK